MNLREKMRRKCRATFFSYVVSRWNKSMLKIREENHLRVYDVARVPCQDFQRHFSRKRSVARGKFVLHFWLVFWRGITLPVVLHCRDTLYRTIYYSRIFVSYRFFETGAVSLMGPEFMGKRRFSGISWSFFEELAVFE